MSFAPLVPIPPHEFYAIITDRFESASFDVDMAMMMQSSIAWACLRMALAAAQEARNIFKFWSNREFVIANFVQNKSL